MFIKVFNMGKVYRCIGINWKNDRYTVKKFKVPKSIVNEDEVEN